MSTPDAAPPPRERLAELRGEIEALDRQLVELIARRVGMAREVGAAKRAAGAPILDPGREAEVVRRASGMARDAGVPEEDVREIFWHLIGMTRRAQAEGAAE